MTKKELLNLKISILALRKSADTALQQIQVALNGATSARVQKRRVTKAERVEAIKARVLSGRRKPETR